MNKKGFITIYGLIVMQVVLAFSSYLIYTLQSYAKSYTYDKKLHYTELYTIQKVKTDFYNYEEENEEYDYLGYRVHLTYDDITCFIHIYQNGEEKISSKLVYDDIECFIVSYEYV